jgi:hypothetical protein
MKISFTRREAEIIAGLMFMTKSMALRKKDKRSVDRIDRILDKIDGDRVFSVLKQEDVYDIHSIVETVCKVEPTLDTEQRGFTDEDLETISKIREKLSERINL